MLHFCTEHGSITAMLCAKLQNDLTPEMDVMDEQDFARHKFNLEFWKDLLYCNSLQESQLTHCYLVKPYGVIKRGQH